MKCLPLLAILLMLANSGAGAQESPVNPDSRGSLPPILQRQVEPIMSPAERATIACLVATDKVMAFYRGQVVEITIGLPDGDLYES
jgi:hypothetical protein